MNKPADGLHRESDRPAPGSMRESIDMAVFAAVRGYVRVSVRLTGMSAGNASAANALLQRAWQGGEVDSSAPAFASWRESYEAVGLGSDVVPPHEALALWAVSPGGVPTQGALNDLANAFSLQHRAPVAVYDTLSVVGDLWLAPARGIETFVPLDDRPAETPPPGELVLADGASNVVARHWHGAQGRLFVADSSARSAIVHIDLTPPESINAPELGEMFVKLATGNLGGDAEMSLLSWDTPRVTWESRT